MPWVFVSVYARDPSTNPPYDVVIETLRNTGTFRAVNISDEDDHVIDVSMNANNVVEGMETVTRILDRELPPEVRKQFDVWHPPL
jgi:hypothetical protein